MLASRQDGLRSAMSGAERAIRWTRPESIHVTLQFLGDIAASLTGEITAGIVAACAGARSVRLALGGMGAFPNVNRPRVVWVGLEGDITGLRAIESAIGEQLRPLGYKPDKPFQPHITLGRIRETARPDELRAISQALAQYVSAPESAGFAINGISLMQSHLQAGGSVYTQLAFVPIGAK